MTSHHPTHPLRLIMRAATAMLLTAATFIPATAQTDEPALVRSEIGDKASTRDGAITITNIGKKQQFNASQRSTYDTDIHSPKSAAFHPDGSRFYVNSLEGCRTIVYDARSMRKLKVINHTFKTGQGDNWTSSPHYKWEHYPNGARRSFSGKPVEMTFSHSGRYLWIPYYRRTFDINAQDPSAMAVVDTRTDSIVRMFDTGPLPKMVSVSNSGRLLAVTHWGDNTVGLIDISSPDPARWSHLPPVTIGNKLRLDFPLNESVNRDSNSGYLLRGTVFLPGDRHMLIGCMAGSIAVVDLKTMKHIGFINNIYNVRHLTLHGKNLFASCNVNGMVWKIHTDSLGSAIASASAAKRRAIKANGWKGCKVGAGARTIEVSPDGRYVYAACNFANRIDIVNARTMKLETSIRCDSYPVGLGRSADGKYMVVTSQGRKKRGGNAVNIFSITRK
ncbi:YncE family protein [Duncaniella muris]|uniref:Peptidoglycan-binding protein n=1 Tax=Duncaniella muris TaxID=2094150 RepID=A0A2V1IMU0_9BACT|nr:peptidoglycan-binding protein [Duncaniella muris]PWB02018.1 peptidoglycan-binding protein [Duncaniella muris]